MARSHYIYLVSIGSRPLAAFTVKHECCTFLERNWPINGIPSNATVKRLLDGREGVVVDITKELLTEAE